MYGSLNLVLEKKNVMVFEAINANSKKVRVLLQNNVDRNEEKVSKNKNGLKANSLKKSIISLEMSCLARYAEFLVSFSEFKRIFFKTKVAFISRERIA